ncbi:Zn-dependent hydrolase [Roseivivax sediminis]|uniref:N-carbamoyl-L-amino-acid hydrolase n=1 Tax=Roseivivax sediminis TaxID=936889 RepID=A0A1I1VA38_9RHOB|nr:Zn-dependent hydrolase [Roseivivax sediminis]SFD79759.1 N-carbamoyl-L-amino-acid hydrolase [Roseivivax sediminis]
MELDKDRLWQRLEKLSEYTDPGRPWTRRAFTDRYARAREWLREEMESAGLRTRMDAGGNLIGSLPGSDPAAGTLVSGSHIDTVPDGGRYDGILGVLSALEAVQSFAEGDTAPRHTMEVVDFLSEEPSDYGVSCVGSRAMSGNLPASLLEYTNPEGERLGEAIRRCGGEPDKLNGALRSPEEIRGFLELHIEQGRVLESAGTRIGVVTNIVGIKRYEIVVTGRADHSGTTPMNLRQDALVGASRIVERINHEAHAQQRSNAYLVGTVGKIGVRPGAANAVPGEARITVEVRSDRQELLDGFLAPIIDWAEEAVCRRGELRLEVRLLSASEPTDCAGDITRTVAEASRALDLSAVTMPSGAGHDAAHMARICPMGMLFVPCLDGRSHCPEESITREDAVNGARVLTRALLDLDRTPPAGADPVV